MNENLNKVESNAQDELLRMAVEERRFTIRQRERTMSEESKKTTVSSIMAATCILGAGIALSSNGGLPNLNEVIQTQLNAAYSWNALGQYFQELGPLVTLFAASAGSFVAKAFKHDKKFRDAKHQFEDMNASLINGNKQNFDSIDDLGRNETMEVSDAKTR